VAAAATTTPRCRGYRRRWELLAQSFLWQYPFHLNPPEGKNLRPKNRFLIFSESQESEENRRIDHQVDFNILVDDRVTIKNVTKIMNRSMSVTFFNRGDFVDIYYTCSKKI
jgi:hypothetical protein